MIGGRKVRMGWSMGPTGDAGRGEGRLQLVFCYSAREETEELGLGEQRVPSCSFKGPERIAWSVLCPCQHCLLHSHSWRCARITSLKLSLG